MAYMTWELGGGRGHPGSIKSNPAGAGMPHQGKQCKPSLMLTVSRRRT